MQVKNALSLSIFIRYQVVKVFLACSALVITASHANAESITKKRMTRSHNVYTLDEFKDKSRALLLKCPQCALSLRNAVSGKELFEYKGSDLVIPASLQKLYTSMYALVKHGPFFKFKTYFRGDIDKRTGEVKTLSITAGGDPSLTTEQLLVIVRELKRRNIKRIGKIVLFNGLFKDTRAPVGEQSFETGNSAMSFNFNALQLRICISSSASVKQKQPEGEVQVSVLVPEAALVIKNNIQLSDENKDALQVVWKDDYSTLQLNGSFYKKPRCVDEYLAIPEPEKYFLKVLTGMLKEYGIESDNSFYVDTSFEENKNLPLLYTHESKYFYEVIKDMNWYSNNFIANQLIYFLSGIEGNNYSSDVNTLTSQQSVLQWSDGIRNLQGFSRSYTSEPRLSLHDGSGLDEKNRVTASSLTNLLYKGLRDPLAAPYLHASLAVCRSGKNQEGAGTLRERYSGFYSSDDFFPIIFGKSGTLDGVVNIAGILENYQKEKIIFAIINNEAASIEEARELEYKLLILLQKTRF
jgi:PBP4 family serine-type D-alanyl-D-alanine carboxypeptidase